MALGFRLLGAVGSRALRLGFDSLQISQSQDELNVNLEFLVTFEDRHSDKVLHSPFLIVHNVHPDSGVFDKDAQGLLAGILGRHHSGGAAEDALEVGVNIRSAEDILSSTGDVESGGGVQSCLSMLVLQIDLQF